MTPRPGWEDVRHLSPEPTPQMVARESGAGQAICWIGLKRTSFSTPTCSRIVQRKAARTPYFSG
jgi:hypothetical protein